MLNTYNRKIKYFAIFIIIILFYYLITNHINKSHNKLYLEVVTSGNELQKGLMYRKTLLENHGMLFDSGKLENKSIWMKNTYIPLDVIFLDDEYKIIGIVENTIPLSTMPISINQPSRYIIEVPGGTCKKRNYHIGKVINYIQISNNVK
jgi:uncharacterized membrane protein (UPF0127 family)